MKKSVIILGAGLSGLSVGLELVENDYNVTIIEKESKVGGLARSFFKDGFVFDYGPHAFYTKDAEIFYKVQNLIKNGLLPFGKMYSSIKIVFQGREYDYPLSLISVLANMKYYDLFLCFLDYLKSLFKRSFCHPSNKTFEDWVINHFGKSLFQIFFESFTEKTWGISTKLLASNFASERIPKLNIWNLIKGLFEKKKSLTDTKILRIGNFNPKYSYYPKKGCWQIGDAIKREIESRGGRIHLQSQVKKLIHENGCVTKVIFEKCGAYKNIKSDFVVSTLPIPELAGIIEPFDKEAKEAGLRLKYRELTLLLLEIDKPKVLDSRLFYFHDPDLIFQRGSEIKFLSNKTVPSKQKTSLTLEITNKDNLSDSKIYEESIKGLEKLGILKKEDIIDYTIIRQPYSYPIYDINYKSNLESFIKGISRINHLILCGRQSLFRYIDMDQCIKMGSVTAQYILGNKSLDEIDSVVAEWSNGA